MKELSVTAAALFLKVYLIYLSVNRALVYISDMKMAEILKM